MIQAFEKILSECEEQIKKDFLGYYEHNNTLMMDAYMSAWQEVLVVRAIMTDGFDSVGITTSISSRLRQWNNAQGSNDPKVACDGIGRSKLLETLLSSIKNIRYEQIPEANMRQIKVWRGV